MTPNEKDALIIYLNFQFGAYVDKYANHVNGEVLQSMYDEMYKMLRDVDNTLEMNIKLLAKSFNKSS
jgi:hypothetical protein